MIRLKKYKDDSFPSVFIHDVVGSVRLACYYSRAAESGDPALRPANGEQIQIHTSAFRRQQSPSERTKLLTRQSQIPSGPKSATNKFCFAVAVATSASG